MDRRESDFDAVVIDLGLPDSTGLDTFDAARETRPSLPAIVMTGDDDEMLAIEAVRRGAQDYIVKGPSSEHSVVRAIRYAMERKRLEEQLLHSQKMQAVGSLADGIVHEFNNLLQVITGHTGYALDGLDPEAQRYRDLQQVMSASERATALTQQLLEFGRPRALNKKSLRIQDVVSELADMLRPILSDGIQFQIEQTDTAQTIICSNRL